MALRRRGRNDGHNLEGRPYRSHSHPACLPCRKRKSRCQTKDDGAEGCLMCQVNGTECTFPRTHAPFSRRSTRSTRAFPSRAEHPNHGPNHQASANQRFSTSTTPQSERYRRPTAPLGPSTPGGDDDGWGIIADIGDNSSHVVSPVVASDGEVLESYLASGPEGSRGKRLMRSYTGLDISSRRSRPVVFNTVPKRPVGAIAYRSRAAEKCELIEKLIEPYAKDLVDLFFAKSNICFPIFDEHSFKLVYSNDWQKISPALLSNIYASALIYWDTSPKLCKNRCPDMYYIWVQAYEALSSEIFLSPGTSTIMSVILNVCGRPSTSIICNGGQLGLAVALCNALGLNRDPSNWNISPLEKQIRIRIWWLVVIHDRWCSLAYGTPLQIHREQHDVPIPSVHDLQPHGASTYDTIGSTVFISLVTLTEVLGRYLEYVYRLPKGHSEQPSTSAMDLELLLEQWEETLSDEVRRAVIRGTNLNAPGTTNLRLAYLAVKLLLRRIQLDLDRNVPRADEGIDSPYYLRAQRAAEDIVYFVQELDEPQCRGFWMSSNAFTLTSATSFLLRSALGSRDLPENNTALKIARDMIDTLRSHRTRFSWDLADNCLANCCEIVEKIEAGTLYSNPDLPNLEGYPDVDMSVLDDLLSGFGDPMETGFLH